LPDFQDKIKSLGLHPGNPENPENPDSDKKVQQQTTMPARDIYHNQVKNALIKEGWLITDDPLSIQFGSLDLYIDLGVEKLIAAKKDEQQIAVEIKSFVSDSPLSEFHTAVGQFINYRMVLEDKEPNRILYLAVPLKAYKTFFKYQLPQKIIQRYHFKLIVYDAQKEVIVKWIN
jgi:hypothetical protein